MAEGLGWFHFAWCLTYSCFMFSRIHMCFEKSCLLHFNGQWKQDQLIFWAVIHNNSWASQGMQIEMHQSVMSKTCLPSAVCPSDLHLNTFSKSIKYLDALTWISFTKFEINFRNLIGCQCFDFVYPKAWSVRPNWHAHWNFVHPESLSVPHGCNDVLWIQCWNMVSTMLSRTTFGETLFNKLLPWMNFSTHKPCTSLVCSVPDKIIFIAIRRILDILYSALHGNQHKDAFT